MLLEKGEFSEYFYLTFLHLYQVLTQLLITLTGSRFPQRRLEGQEIYQSLELEKSPLSGNTQSRMGKSSPFTPLRTFARRILHRLLSMLWLNWIQTGIPTATTLHHPQLAILLTITCRESQLESSPPKLEIRTITTGRLPKSDGRKLKVHLNTLYSTSITSMLLNWEQMWLRIELVWSTDQS